MMRFYRKSAFFWKMAIISGFYIRARARAARAARARAGYLSQYQSDRSEIRRDDSLGYSK